MDHETAIRIRATERYALEEMSPEESAEFEAHYFDCADCAEDVKVAVSFTLNARAWFKRQADWESRGAPEPVRVSAWSWLRPAWVSPAFACLFAVVAGYSWFVAVPNARRQAAPLASLEALAPVVLRGELRGEEGPLVERAPHASIALLLNVESERQYPAYDLEILNPSGAIVSRLTAPGSSSITLHISGDMLSDGRYTIVLRGDAHGRPEIGKYRFQVRTRAK
jgi:hypothetical protein